jgi:hypothetical protein
LPFKVLSITTNKRMQLDDIDLYKTKKTTAPANPTRPTNPVRATGAPPS